MKKPPINVVDLFAGAGGLTSGFHAASPRYTPIRAVEMDEAASASYEETFGTNIMYPGTIQNWLQHETLQRRVDVVIGGPPCQGFSTLGRRDIEDERNMLWQYYAQGLHRLKPQYFVLENVAIFLKSRQFEQLQHATQRGELLEDYVLTPHILNAADYGAAQSRRRAVVIGYHRDLEDPGMPLATHSKSADHSGLDPYVTVGDALSDSPLKPDRDHVFKSRSIDYRGTHYAGAFTPRDLHWSRNYTALSRKRFAEIPPGGNRFSLPDSLLAPCWRKHKTGSADVMGRLHLDRPSVTIRTEFFKPEKGRYLHPTEDRAITHYEAALLQGFSPEHKFVGSRTSIARQIGNAVPIPLGAAIGKLLEEHL